MQLEIPSATQPAPGDAQAPVPQDQAQPDATQNDVLSSAFDTASSPSTVSPNMFGDIFTGSTSTSTIITSGVLSGQLAITTFGGVQQDNSPQTDSFGIPPNVAPVTPVTVTLSAVGTTILAIPDAAAAGITFSQGVANPSPSSGVIPLGAVAPTIQPSIDAATAPGGPGYIAAQNVERAANPTAQLVSLNAQLQDGNYTSTGADPNAIANLSYNTLVTDVISVQIYVANPAGGGVVGRNKISEDNSPLPRDRVFFNYDYFKNTSLTANGWDVNRYNPGFEKTFFNRRASFELRIPFAATLSSDLVGTTGSTQTQIGNTRVALKTLPYASNTFNIATGVALSLPTTNTVSVGGTDGTSFLKILNRTTIVTPYIAALWTPTSRFFAQSWVALDVDPSGNPVYVNPIFTGTALTYAGRLNEGALLQLDNQIGYWMMRSNEGWIRGLAPFFELHYNGSVGKQDLVVAGPYTIGNTGGNYDILTVSSGLIAQVGDNLNVGLGAVVPVRGGLDHNFDYQIGLRASYFFGATARARQQAAQVTNF